ncbi:MAG: hypothetical protein GF364_17520 [Candidatus Lokiarchaeota archaeon]|nr:hypothetical protein [Candidatus Lokiarchaeota archaeon]
MINYIETILINIHQYSYTILVKFIDSPILHSMLSTDYKKKTKNTFFSTKKHTDSNWIPLKYFVFSILIGIIGLLIHLSVSMKDLMFTYIIYSGLILYGVIGTMQNKKEKERKRLTRE